MGKARPLDRKKPGFLIFDFEGPCPINPEKLQGVIESDPGKV